MKCVWYGEYSDSENGVVCTVGLGVVTYLEQLCQLCQPPAAYIQVHLYRLQALGQQVLRGRDQRVVVRIHMALWINLTDRGGQLEKIVFANAESLDGLTHAKAENVVG